MSAKEQHGDPWSTGSYLPNHQEWQGHSKKKDVQACKSLSKSKVNELTWTEKLCFSKSIQVLLENHCSDLSGNSEHGEKWVES